jgi:hypothetical protein
MGKDKTVFLFQIDQSKIIPDQIMPLTNLASIELRVDSPQNTAIRSSTWLSIETRQLRRWPLPRSLLRFRPIGDLK